jgi:adenine-specific DNA-methyltransferase
MLYPSNGACWRYQQGDMLEIMRGWCDYELKDLHDERERAKVCGVSEDEVRQGVMGIVLSEELETSRSKAMLVLNRGQWPRFFFTKNGEGGIARKTYLENVGGKLVTNFWPHIEVGHTDEAKKEMLSIFDGKATFDTPKPSRLIERVLQVAADKEATILDSFAGSGTTAHAVLNLNKQDGGNRKFILVETEDYAETITAERVKRVICGYGEGNNAVDGTGGDFSFYELGDVLLLADGNLNESVGVDRIRAYVYFMETKQTFGEKSPKENDYFLGTHNQTAYYFYYEPETVTTLDDSFLATIRTRADGYLIYADRLALSTDDLRKFNIVFKKIPRDISRL